MGTTPDSTITGIDIGTGTIRVLVGELGAEGNLAYVGSAVEPSQGLHRGGVVDLEAATAALVAALDRAEDDSRRRINSAYVLLSGLHLEARNLHGAATIIPTERGVAPEDVARAIAAARVALPDEQHGELVHLMPRGYTLDGQEGIHNPLGMIGHDLWVEAHAVTGKRSHIANLVKCLREARIEPEDLIAAPLAAAEGALPAYPDERSPVVIDLGAETLSIAIYDDGAIWHTKILPLGCDDMTRDIALELRLPVDAAEAIKRRYGHCYPTAVAGDELVELQPLTQLDELLPRRLLAEILHVRAEVYAHAIAERLRMAHEAGIRPSVIVLTGGGAQLPGLSPLFEEVLRVPTAIGRPHGIVGLPAHLAQPQLAGAAGLLQWGARQRRRQESFQRQGARRTLLPHLVAGAKRLMPPARF